MGVQFLNVDLEVHSGFDLLSLREGMGDRVCVMFCGETEPGNFLLSVEHTEATCETQDPDQTSNALCQLVEELSGTAWDAWVSADDRVFDLGFEAILDARSGQPLLLPETLQRIASLNARLAFSVYTHHLK